MRDLLELWRKKNSCSIGDADVVEYKPTSTGSHLPQKERRWLRRKESMRKQGQVIETASPLAMF